MRGSSVRRGKERGLVLLAVLLFVLVTTLASSSLVVVYATQMQREREEELLFVGVQFRKAIASYYNTIPAGGAQTLPLSLEDLVNDGRFPKPIQHLRRIYPDPMTGRPDWDLIQVNGGVVGIKSRSTKSTMKKKGFPSGLEHLEDTQHYTDWKFSVRQF